MNRTNRQWPIARARNTLASQQEVPCSIKYNSLQHSTCSSTASTEAHTNHRGTEAQPWREGRYVLRLGLGEIRPCIHSIPPHPPSLLLGCDPIRQSVLRRHILTPLGKQMQGGVPSQHYTLMRGELRNKSYCMTAKGSKSRDKTSRAIGAGRPQDITFYPTGFYPGLLRRSRPKDDILNLKREAFRRGQKYTRV